MSKIKMDRLLAEAREAVKDAREIQEKADREGRGLTTKEKADFDRFFKQAEEAKAKYDAVKAEIASMEKVNALFAGVIGPADFDNYDGQVSQRSNSSTDRKRWAKSATKTFRNAMPSVGGNDSAPWEKRAKSIVSGSVTVPTIVPVSPELPKVPNSVLDLLPTYGSDGSGSGNTFSYLRQTVRTNNAAPVADNATKPTSIFTLTPQEDKFRVVAHLSEPMPIRFFDDYTDVETFLSDEMAYGVQRALESQIVSGDGTGENFTGLLNTSGIQTATAGQGEDILTVLYKAITSLQVVGVTPTAFVLSPADTQALALLREDDTTGQYLLGSPGSEPNSTLWGIPVIASNSVAPGTAILADWTKSRVLVREETHLDSDLGGELFGKNQAVLRVEGRFGFAVIQPVAFVKITLPSE